MTEPTAPVAAPDLLATLEAARGDAAVLADTLYRHVCRSEAAGLASSHAPESDGRGHALLASAVAYCVGYELRAAGAPVDPTLLRVAALAHDLALPAEALALLPAPVPRWLANRDLFFDALPGSPFPLHHWTVPAERALYAAHLVAALPLPVAPNRPATQAFREHPLGRGEPLASVALVYGGATRIKGYVFESPRLPEIRGASGLLDRINRVDLPALFGARFDAPADAAAAARIRAWFAARGGAAPLEAPECVLYAGGGNLLALAPSSLAEALQAAIEAWYATETLVAQSVAASRACELLELQYGRQPTRYWWQEYAAVQADDALRALLGYPSTPASPSPVEPPPGKGFGELTTELVLLAARRRDERATYPNWETPPYTRRCASCDRRAASAAGARAGAELCLPCWRKRQAGEQLGRGSGAGFRAWIDRFVEYLESDGADTPYARAAPPGGWAIVESPADLDDIGAASDPPGYLGVIYADGDAMGDQLERQTTPAAFRAFSERLAEATEHAVYAALARHLRPVQGRDGRWQHPFEVLNIGGDDVLLLVPGSVALATAAAIGREFEARFPAAAGAEGDGWADQRYHPPDDPRARAIHPPRPARQSLSAGIVVAPMATPMALLRELAEQLQQSAKQTRRAVDGDVPRGWGDFLVIKGAGLLATSLDGWRRQALGTDSGEAGRRPRGQRGRGRRPPRLSATPYTWPELEGLLATARALGASGYPRTQLHAVRELLAQGEAAASVDYLYYRTRLEPHHRRQVVAHLEQAWSGPEGRPRWPSHRPGASGGPATARTHASHRSRPSCRTCSRCTTSARRGWAATIPRAGTTMPRIEIELRVRVRGALSVGGLASGETLADRQVVRDGAGRLLLPGSQVKGRMRHACEQVARTLGRPVCQAPRAAAMCPHDAAVPTPPCVVCALFGAPAWRSPLRWTDLHCRDELPVDGAAGARLPAALRAGVALNRRRGTAEDGRLFLQETSPPLPTPGLVFAHPRAIRGHLPDAAALQLLLAGCRLLTSFGAGETRGLGWSEVDAVARVDGAPVVFEPNLLLVERQ